MPPGTPPGGSRRHHQGIAVHLRSGCQPPAARLRPSRRRQIGARGKRRRIPTFPRVWAGSPRACSGPADAPTVPPMRIAVIGPLEVQSDDLAPVPVPGAKERLLLAALAAGAPGVVRMDELAETLWDGDPPASARKSLQSQGSYCRRTARTPATSTWVACWTVKRTAPRTSAVSGPTPTLTYGGRWNPRARKTGAGDCPGSVHSS
jgi:hypothetical protein